KAKTAAAEADAKAATELKKEAEARLKRQERLSQTGGGSPEELGLARATWEKQKAEEISKAQAINVAKAEQAQSETVLRYYELHSRISGKIKTFYKRPGEPVKAFEPVLQVYGDERVRVEGLLDQKYLGTLREAMKGKGVRVVIEAAPDQQPIGTLLGHLLEVTGVAVSQDSKWIMSGSDDGSVRRWEAKARTPPHRLQEQSTTPVKAVACTPPSARANLCVAGMKDGHGRIWNLDNEKASPVDLETHHSAAI